VNWVHQVFASPSRAIDAALPALDWNLIQPPAAAAALNEVALILMASQIKTIVFFVFDRKYYD
jgi:hypothetical protein